VISKSIQDAFNEQINEELASAYIYLAMAAWFASEGYDGMASWMRTQYQEETMHAMKFFDHIVERGGKVELAAVKAPKGNWASPLEAFKAAYKHEQYITGRINELMKLARGESDYAAEGLLGWFVTEQVEEEANTGKAVDMLEKVQDSPNGVFMIDRLLAGRPAAAPSGAGSSAAT
jgi:ferritin